MVEFLKSLSSCSSLEVHNLKMHMQTHMSGQIPNQAGPQLSGLPLQNGNSMPPIQNLVGLRNTSSMDLDLEMKRKYLRDQIMDLDLELKRKFLRDQIYQKLVQHRPQMTLDIQPKMKDIARRLEECLFKSATSKEECMNMDTLDQRLHTLIRRLPAANHSQQGYRNTSSMDLDLEMKRKYLRDQIYQKLVQRHQKLVQRRPQMTPDMLPNMKDIVKRLEECLFKSATSKEEYMNMDTLDQRLGTLIRRLPAANHSQQLPHHPSSSSTCTMIPTPGISHSGNMNLSVTSSLDTSMNATSGYNAFVVNTVNIGNPNANVSSVGRYGGFFSTSDGALPNGYQQSPSHVSMDSGGNKLPSVFTPEKMDAQKKNSEQVS